MHNIINEPPPTELHGRLKFTTERFVEAADITGRDVLDIGCGYGWFELWAARKRGVKHITGLDMTPADLQTASQHIKELNVLFKEGGATKLPIESNAIDTVVSWEVIEHIPPNTEPVMFDEVRRVLRPGGCFYLSTPNGTLRSILGDPTYWMINHRHYMLSYFAELAAAKGFSIAKSAVRGGVIEIADMWNLYVSKWIFRRDRFFKQRSLQLTDRDYWRDQGFNTLFVKFVKH